MIQIRLAALSFLLCTFMLAQIPTNYYDSANGLTGYALKTELKNIISNGHSAQSYSNLWNFYLTANLDSEFENDGTILDIYSENPAGIDPYEYNPGSDQCGSATAEGDCYNREHFIPATVYNQSLPMYSDAHSVWPTDGFVNNARGTFPFGETNNPTTTTQNGTEIGSGNNTAYTNTVFEPVDAFKGDVARALFYFATRYEDNVAGYNYDMFNGTSNQVFADWVLPTLINWHLNDPVSDFERARNQEAYSFQGNANPFIDHPEYVGMIWSDAVDTESPSVPMNLSSSNITATTFLLSWNASTDNVAVDMYDVYVDGNMVGSTSNTQFEVNGLSPETTYAATVAARDGAGNSSAQSSSLQVTTTSASTANEIFFTEYIEGSSNNKALEISNFTGSAVDLSAYDIRIYQNGNTAAGGTYTMPMLSLADGESFVLVNPSLTCNTGSFNVDNANVTQFNGNDAIGLYKNNTLIDLIGEIGNSANFAQNVTLRRKLDINEPTQVFDPQQWDSFTEDTCDDLGMHTINLSVLDSSVLESQIKVYPNPNKGAFHIELAPYTNGKVNVYTLEGKAILMNKEITSANNSISGLASGIYLVQIQLNNKIVTKKVLVIE